MVKKKSDLTWIIVWVLVLQALVRPRPIAVAEGQTHTESSSNRGLSLSDLTIVDSDLVTVAQAEMVDPLPLGAALSGDHTLPLPPAGPFAAPPARPLSRDIPLSLLRVSVTGPDVASIGSSPGAGEIYTAVIRNNSLDTAYGVFLTATLPAYFAYDSGGQLVSGSGSIPVGVSVASSIITWTPTSVLDLAPGDVITLSFRLRAGCNARSGQQMRIGVRYNADPPPELPVELNDAGLNITTGRGNLVIRKDPALQDLGTADFGRPITWIVTVQNTGLGRLYGARITDTGGINLSQPGGDLQPSATLPMLDVNAVQTYTVIGTVEACNLTNVAQGSWVCGNLVGDATVTNPVKSTASVLFRPDLPNVDVDVSFPVIFPYCDPVVRTVLVTLTNTGGPAADFRLDSTFESDGFLEVIQSSVPGDWQYSAADGIFAYVGGSPTGVLAGEGAGQPVTLAFDVWPRSSPVCGVGSGQTVFTPLYEDVCQGNPFVGDPASLQYEYAVGEPPSLRVSKTAPQFVASGEVFTFVITVSGDNPANISGPIYVTDVLPIEFLPGSVSVSDGGIVTEGQRVSWLFDPPDSPSTFVETMTIQARAAITEDICGSTMIVVNSVEAFALPICPGCPPLVDTDPAPVAIVNNEGVFAANGASGAFEACDDGFVLTNTYLITGSMFISWTGTVFTEALGTALGDGSLPGSTYLDYVAGSLSVTVNGFDYTAFVTPIATANGPLVIDLSPLSAAGAPTQNMTIYIVYTVQIPEAALDGAVEQTFYDWSQLYLPSITENQACAANDSYNQVRILTIGRGDLSVDLAPRVLDRCSPNPVRIMVTDGDPTRVTDNVVITFTSSSAEIMSARGFASTGGLPTLLPGRVVTNPDIGGGRGMITFTFPADADVTGDGEIQFVVDVNCTDLADWNAGITFQSLCNVTYGDAARLDHVYRAPGLILFATPIQYTVRERDVLWKFFVGNNGNLTATNVLVTNAIDGLSVISYSSDSAATISVSGTLPITDPTPVPFLISELGPGQQREVTVTARISNCDPLRVDIDAEQGCFGTTCNQDQATITFNLPDR